MFKKEKLVVKDLAEAKKTFLDNYDSFKETFSKALTSIKTFPTSVKNKPSFIEYVNKNMKIFFYPKSVEKKTMMFYISFGRNCFKLTKLMKIDGTTVFKEDTSSNHYPNQICMSYVESMTPYLSYLLEHIYTQLQIINSDNLKKKDSPLVIFDQKIKSLMVEKKLCPSMSKPLDIIVKGLGTKDFISFGIKNVDIEITFKTEKGIYIYTCDKQQFQRMFNKEYEIDEKTKKKGFECKELLKWIELNKMDEKRTKYFIIPSQINIEKKDLSELPFVKKFISELENNTFAEDLETFLKGNITRTILVNLKFSLFIRMKIEQSTCGNSGELDGFASALGDAGDETFEEREAEVLSLHRDFLKKFRLSISENNITGSTEDVKESEIPVYTVYNDISNKIKIEKPAPPVSDQDDDDDEDGDEKSDTDE